MMKGLFGKSMKPDYMMPAYSMPQSGTIMDGVNLGTPAPQQQRQPGFWQGGGKFTGRDALAAALAAVGDGLRGWAGGPTGAVESLIAGRAAPGQQAAALAAEQRKRAAELADYEAKQQIDQRYKTPQVDDFDRDMARAGILPGTPQYDAYAREYADRKARGADPFLQGAPLPGGGTFTGPFSEYQGMLSGGAPAGGGQAPPRPVGRLTPIGGGGASNGTGSF